MARKNVAGVPGTDPTLPKVPLTLNGKTYNLCYDYNAIATVEHLTGLNLFEQVSLQNLSALSFRAILFSALLKHQPDITLEEVGNLIVPSAAPAITVALVHAWTGSLPEVKETDDKENPPSEQ